MVSLEFIIPAYNEESILLETVRSIRREFQGSFISVVDDGSADNTRRLCAREGIPCKSIRHSGYGGAVRAGFESARGDYLVLTDADLPFDPVQLKAAIGDMRGADLFMLEREIYEDDFARRLLSVLYRKLALCCLPVGLLGGREIDVNSFKVVRRRALDGIVLGSTGWIFGTELIYKFQKNDRLIAFGPKIKCVQRRNGRSKVIFSSVVGLFFDLLKLKAGAYG